MNTILLRDYLAKCQPVLYHWSMAISDPKLWVDQYGDILYSYALKFINDPSQAENLVQETFLAALKSQSSFEGKSSEQTWLIGILKHKITDTLRAKYKEVPASQLTPQDMHIEQFFDQADFGHLAKAPGRWSLDPGQVLQNEEFWNVFQECLGRLPEKAGQAFALRELEQMDSKEVCKVLNISATNLWVLLHRARLQLRQCLEQNWFKS